jgi:hypothetical protein
LKVQWDNTHNNSGFSVFHASVTNSFLEACGWQRAQVCSE